MLKVTRAGANRLDIEMSGKLDAGQMQQALDELLKQSEGIENGEMRYDIAEYHLPSLDAIIIEFSRFPEMIGFMKKFARAAVLTNATWLKMASEFEGVLIPGLEIKAFSRDQKTEAEAWLSH